MYELRIYILDEPIPHVRFARSEIDAEREIQDAQRNGIHVAPEDDAPEGEKFCVFYGWWRIRKIELRHTGR